MLKRFSRKHIITVGSFLLILFLLWHAHMVIWCLYSAILLLMAVVFPRRLMPFSAFICTLLVGGFYMPQILRGTHWALYYASEFFGTAPQLVYEAKTSETPVISIVMPAYNYDKFVQKALHSAATQDFALPYEVVVVEDGSSDQTLQVVMAEAQKHRHVRVFSYHENKGLISAKNAGIALARGTLIFNLDADDWMEKDALSLLYATMNNAHADMAYTWVMYEGAKQGIQMLCAPDKVTAENCVSNSILYHKRDGLQFGGYSRLFANGLEDWDFWLNFQRHNKKIVRTPRPVYHYFVKENSRQDLLNRKGYAKIWWLVQAKNSDRLTWMNRLMLLLAAVDQRRIGGFHALLGQAEASEIDKMQI